MIRPTIKLNRLRRKAARDARLPFRLHLSLLANRALSTETDSEAANFCSNDCCCVYAVNVKTPVRSLSHVQYLLGVDSF
jgi:hypothetical protein